MNYDGYLAAFPERTVLNNYSGECVSNIANYLDFNGLHGSIAYANAKDWANHPAMRSEFTWVANNPNDLNQVPKRGDIVVWDGNLAGSQGYGHIAIYDRRIAPGQFSSYDNNWGGRYLHFVTHNYNNVSGWFTRKVSAPPSGGGEIMDNRDKVVRQFHTLRGFDAPVAEAEIQGWIGGAYDTFNIKAEPEVRNIDAAKRDTQVQIANLTNLNNQLNQQLGIATDTANTTKAERDAAVAKATDLQAQLTDAMDKLKEAQTAPTVPVVDTIQDARIKQFIKWFRELLGIN